MRGRLAVLCVIVALLAPAQIVASHSTGGKVDRTRPLCPDPQVAAYKGSGSIDEASSLACRNPK